MTNRRGNPQRFLATILFTDIVDSTALAASIGDEAWRILLRRYYAMARERLKRHGGHEIDTAGDGLFASFEAPAQAIGCALDLRDAALELGVSVRSGLHMGEVQTIEGKVGGIAVHIGARIAAAAGPGEVLVSSTVKDLVTGSRLRFEDRGEAELKGVPGSWRLFLALPPSADTSAPVAPAAATPAAGGHAAGAAGGPRPGRRLLLGGAVVLAAFAVAASGLLLATRPAPAVVPPASSSSAPPSVAVGANGLARVGGDGRIASFAAVGNLPSGIAVAGDGSIWVTNAGDASVSRLDDTHATVTDTVTGVGSDPIPIAFGDQAIWVGDSGGRTISRIDPATKSVSGPFTVGNAPSGIAADENSLWVSDRLDGTLVQFDAEHETIERTIPVGISPAGVAVGAGSVWVSDYDAGTVARVDPADGSVSAPIAVGNGASAIAASDSAVWVANKVGETVSHIDPATNAVVATLPVGGEPTGIAIGSDAVWVAVPSASQFVRIDQASDRIVPPGISLDVSPLAVAIDGQEPVFTSVAAVGAASQHSGGTLHLVSDASGMPKTADPAYIGFVDISSPRLLLLTNDGLVGYRRQGGAEGQELVGDLATSVPSPTDGGLTYRFQLRSGIVFSDHGESLKASDVVRSAERSMAAASTGTTFSAFGGVLGADKCTVKQCDLSKGIVADDAAGTVTIHLASPDPYFVYGLALAQSFITPAGTSLGAAPGPLPATGPYVFDQFDKTGIVLKRNPRFQEWSPEAQPNGFPDEIDWSPDSDPVGAVSAGRADWVEPSSMTPDQVQSLEADRTGQLSIAPAPETWFEMMNTKVAPFDKLEVRQAVNWATDRQAVANAFGGGHVTCQVVPPVFAGYKPTCPYTTGQDTSGEWRHQDLDKARAMIDASGDKNMKVVVWGADRPGFRDVTEYFVQLLDALGFRAEMHLMPGQAYFESPASPLAGPSTDQMAGFWISANAPTAATEFAGLFTCPDFPDVFYGGYPSQFCDRSLDREVAQGLALEQQGDPASRVQADALWETIDQEVVRDAPAVMPFNPVDVTYLSKRVGNFQHHPFLAIVLDQLWVQ